MRLFRTATAVSAAALLPTLVVCSSLHAVARAPPSSSSFNHLYLASHYKDGDAAPGATTDDAPGQDVRVGGTGANDASQVPHCPTIFIRSAAVGGSMTHGWTEIPEVVGFYVDRNLTYDGGAATFPVYMETGKDYSKVKRVVIGQPGKPRDAWKYANLFRNALVCAVANSTMQVDLDDVLIVAPIYITKDDRKAGMGEASDVYFGSGGWSVGSKAQGPGNADPSSFDALDDLIKRFAQQTEFPSLTSIIVAGHSLGASVANRYAMLRNADAKTDALVQFWSGNPGAYVWPSASRPKSPKKSKSCRNEANEWPYGVDGTLPAYVDGTPSADTLYARFRARTYQFALGLKDHGPGDTHCQAQYQGSSHLQRGQNMQKALQGMAGGGMPGGMSFNFVANTSHQDYKMMADANSQRYLFVTGLNQGRPAGTETQPPVSRALAKGGGASQPSSSALRTTAAQSTVVALLLVSMALVATL